MSLHMAVGRADTLASIPHVLAGLGIAGIGLACAAGLREARGPDPSIVAVGVLFVWSLAGFVADQAWHDRFGPDLSLWTPPHVMMGGGTLVPLALWVFAGRAGPPARTGLFVGWGAGALVAMTGWQAEHLAALPLVPQSVHPFLVVTAGTLVCTAARVSIGRSGASRIVALTFVLHLGLAAAVVLLGQASPHLSLYAGAALAAEMLPLRMPTFLRGIIAGLVTLLGEAVWQSATGRRPWTVALLIVAAPVAVAAGWAGTALGEHLASVALRLAVPPRWAARSMTAGAVLVAAFAFSVARTPATAEADVTLTPVDAGIVVTARVHPDAIAREAYWFEVLDHRGGRATVVAMTHARDGWVSRSAVPTSPGSRTLLRLHAGRALLAAALVPGRVTLRPEARLWARPGGGPVAAAIPAALGLLIVVGIGVMLRAARDAGAHRGMGAHAAPGTVPL